MRLTLTFAVRTEHGEPAVHNDSRLELDGKLLATGLSDYADRELVDAGVVGGEIWLWGGSNPRFDVIFWLPGEVSAEVVARLQAFAIGQFLDGVGENGFTLSQGGGDTAFFADTDAPVKVEVRDDGRHIPMPSMIAIAARDGNLPLLESAISSEPANVDQRHQGFTPLHLAILGGHIDAVLRLLANGANPNLADPEGATSLELCALSNSLDDEQSSLVAEALMGAGASPNHVNENGDTAVSYAELRGKHRTRDFLLTRRPLRK